MLLGIVVRNKQDKYLILKTKLGDQIDLGLISAEVQEDNLKEEIKNLLIKSTGVDFSLDLEKQPLMRGEDADGKFLILFCEKDFGKDELAGKEAELIWASFDRIKHLYQNKRLNKDQFTVFQHAKYEYRKNKISKPQAMKINHLELKNNKLLERDAYKEYVEKNTDKRLYLRLIHKRKSKTCGRESREYGYLIGSTDHHGTFENCPNLMNDREFLLDLARVTPNPVDCGNYFYMYINEYLKQDSNFRLEFLKAIYLNDNVYYLKDINLIVEECGFAEENNNILNDLEFKKMLEAKLKAIDYRDQVDYHCSGEDAKELHKYKVKANEIKVLCENKKIGLKEILNSFHVGEKQEIEPQTYYEFLCSMQKNRGMQLVY